MSCVSIRKYSSYDRQAIRTICYETAFNGDSAEIFFGDKGILADVVTSYYTDYEPESIFVAQVNQNIVGYLTGCLLSRRYFKVWIFKILPKVTVKFLYKGAIFRLKNFKFLCHLAISFLKGDFKKPFSYREYPAHLHINIIKDYRGMGIGSKLINAFLEYVRTQEIKGIVVTSASLNAKTFFERKGFQLIYTKSIKCLNYLSEHPSWLYVLARKIA